MSRLGDWFTKEKQKISQMESGKKKARYIWTYYKLWIIGILCLVSFLIYGVVLYNTAIKENWFYIMMANTTADVGTDSEFWRGYVSYTGYDLKEKNVEFNASSYFTPGTNQGKDYYTYFVAYVEAGTLDAVTMEREDLEVLGAGGRLMDLSNTDLCGDLARRYADRLVYVLPLDESYSTQPVPVGIDLSDTCLVTRYHIYPESCVLGIGAYSQHPDAVQQFLDYVFEESE